MNLKSCLVFLSFFCCFFALTKPTNIRDTISSIQGDLFVRAYGKSDVNTFALIHALDSVFQSAEVTFLVDDIDDYALKYYRQVQVENISSRFQDQCLIDYFESVQRLSERVHGLRIEKVINYIKELQPGTWGSLSDDFRSQFDEAIPSLPTYHDLEKNLWLYENISRRLNLTGIDSVLFLQFIGANYRHPHAHLLSVKKGVKGRKLFFENYAINNNVKWMGKRFLKKEPELFDEQTTIINLIAGKGVFETRVNKGYIENVEFINNIDGEYLSFDVIAYDDLPNKIQIFEGEYVNKKHFKDQINVYVDEVRFCEYMGAQ